MIQIPMFIPQKLITVAIAVVLLAPFGYLFWRIATHHTQPEADARATMLEDLRERKPHLASQSPDGDFSASSIQIVRYDTVGFFRRPILWMAFFPHRWAGVVGLVGIALILIVVIVTLFIPCQGVSVSASELDPTPPSSVEESEG